MPTGVVAPTTGMAHQQVGALLCVIHHLGTRAMIPHGEKGQQSQRREVATHMMMTMTGHRGLHMMTKWSC
jgi:hypothetical protein